MTHLTPFPLPAPLLKGNKYVNSIHPSVHMLALTHNMAQGHMTAPRINIERAVSIPQIIALSLT
jgi:hypothetical protein